MKQFYLILLLIFSFGATAQDFNIEYKAYLLQSYFKERKIKTLTIQKSSDSLFARKSIECRLEFDKSGRLIKILDYYFDTDSIPERMIMYSYADEAPYYKSKRYHYLASEIGPILKKSWLVFFDFENNTLTEKFQNKKEDYRVNSLVFNKGMQILSRTVEVYVIKIRTQFNYDRDGLLMQVQLIKDNPTVKKMQRLELNQYLQYNLHQKIMTTEQWMGERDKQLNEYYFNYSGINIGTKVGWSLLNWSSDDKKLIERTNFSYNKSGLITKADYFTDNQVSNKHKYTGFEYSFFDGNLNYGVSSDRFTTLWFTDIFAENLIHP